METLCSDRHGPPGGLSLDNSLIRPTTPKSKSITQTIAQTIDASRVTDGRPVPAVTPQRRGPQTSPRGDLPGFPESAHHDHTRRYVLRYPGLAASMAMHAATGTGDGPILAPNDECVPDTRRAGQSRNYRVTRH